MHIVIIGFGSIGQRHLRVFRSLMPDAYISVVRQYGTVDQANPPEGADAITNDLNSVIEQKPDASILAGPATDRMKTALKLVEAGIHVFVEKPIATSTDDVSNVLATARKNKCVFLVGYVLRYLPVLKALKSHVENGLLGRVYALHAHVGQHLADWRPNTDHRKGVTAQAKLGGGAIFELSHELDYVRWLLGTPDKLTCRTQRLSQLTVDVEDIAEITMEYDGSAFATIHMDLLQKPASRFCVVIGDKGRIEADLLKGTLIHIDTDGKSVDMPVSKVNSGATDIYETQAKHFLSCIIDHCPPQVTGEDGLAVLEIALAAKESARNDVAVTMNKV